MKQGNINVTIYLHTLLLLLRMVACMINSMSLCALPWKVYSQNLLVDLGKITFYVANKSVSISDVKLFYLKVYIFKYMLLRIILLQPWQLDFLCCCVQRATSMAEPNGTSETKKTVKGDHVSLLKMLITRKSEADSTVF